MGSAHNNEFVVPVTTGDHSNSSSTPFPVCCVCSRLTGRCGRLWGRATTPRARAALQLELETWELEYYQRSVLFEGTQVVTGHGGAVGVQVLDIGENGAVQVGQETVLRRCWHPGKPNLTCGHGRFSVMFISLPVRLIWIFSATLAVTLLLDRISPSSGWSASIGMRNRGLNFARIILSIEDMKSVSSQGIP
jgi:hypothetical protein